MHARLHNFTDWQAATAHMTRTEKTIYFDLCAMYFTSEQGIDGSDMALLERRLCCVTDDEKAALAFVLKDKFKKVGERYKCQAWDNEIKNYRYRHRNERNETVTDTVTNSNADRNEYRNENITPLSNAERQQKARAERKKMVDELTQKGVQVAKDMGLTELRKLYNDHITVTDTAQTQSVTDNDTVTERNEHRNERNAKNNAITINHKPKTSNHNTNPPNPPQGERVAKTKPSPKKLEFCFDYFWATYPRKQARAKAKLVLDKILTNAPDIEQKYEEIMTGLEKNLDYLTAQASKDGGNFCPYATTWLNGEGWLDEPLTTKDPLAVNQKHGKTPFIPTTTEQEYDQHGNPIFRAVW